MTVLILTAAGLLATGSGLSAGPVASAVPAPAEMAMPTYPLAPGETSVGIRAKAERSLHSSGRVGSSQWVGLAYPHGSVVSRVYYSFDLSGLPPESFTSVTLYNAQVFSPNRTCNLDSYGPPVAVATTARWSAKLAWPGPKVTSARVTSGYAVGSRPACVPAKDQEWDVTEMVRSAAATSSTVYLRLASTDEKDRRGYRRYNTDISGTPELLVHLIPHPNQPTDVAVSPLVTNHPRSANGTALPWPLIVNSPDATLSAHLTTPGAAPALPS